MNIEMLDKYIANTILKSNKRRFDIEKAPFKIGDCVKVLDNPNNDDTFNPIFVGMAGVVEFFEYDCGCGQSFPEDPMIGVRFVDNK